MEGFLNREWGAYPPRVALLRVYAPQPIRYRPVELGFPPCGAVSTPEKSFFVPGVSGL